MFLAIDSATWRTCSGVMAVMLSSTSSDDATWLWYSIERPVVMAACSRFSEATISWPRYCLFAASICFEESLSDANV